MSSPVTQIPPGGRPAAAGRPETRPEGRPEGRPATEAPRPTSAAAAEQRRAQLNAQIVRASEQASINAGNEPLALLFRSAIEQLNEMLAPTLGENAIQNAMNQDNTPEGTASRIVSLSTGFYEAFKEQHGDEAEADVLQKFMETIRSGFEKGFREAESILQGLGVLDGEIAAGINRTYELVLEGYARFEQARSAAPGAPADDAGPEVTPPA